MTILVEQLTELKDAVNNYWLGINAWQWIETDKYLDETDARGEISKKRYAVSIPSAGTPAGP